MTGIAIGWRTPFSERGDRKFSHLLVASHYAGLAHRACLPGQVVNAQLAEPEAAALRRCAVCTAIEAKQQQVRAAA